MEPSDSDFAVRSRDASDLVYPRFHIKPVEQTFQSERQGRPIYEDREFVEIVIAGDSKTTVVEEVNDDHKRRWGPQYKAFKEGMELPTEGTPIEEWAVLGASKVLELKALRIRTVEHLANLNDGTLNSLGVGGRELRARAKAWLESASSGAPLEKALADLEAEKAKTTVLERNVADLAAKVQALLDKDAANARAAA